MAKKLEHLSLTTVGLMAEEEKQYYVDEHIYITMNAQDFGKKNLRIGQPYRVNEGRVMLVTRGWVRVIVNLEEHLLEPQSIIVLLAGSIFEIQEYSNDFDMQAFSFQGLSIVATSLHRHFVHTFSDDEWQLCEEYVHLLWHEVHRQPLLPDVIKHLQTAFLLELQRIASREEAVRQKSASRQDIFLHRFLDLVNQHGLKERKIEFYADRLCVTPNHLGAVIRQASGLTIMQWLNRHAIQESKVLLKYSDMPIWEVAERMNFANPSFFSKFFKQQTGMTPGEFRDE